jgi:ketosteroid isomerase-like protein
MKNKMFHAGALLTVMFCFVSMAYSQNTDELKARIMKNNEMLAKAMVDGNSQESMSMYTNDAVSLPNFGKMVSGIDAIKKSNDEMMSSGMKIKSVEFNTVSVNAYGNIVSEIGTYKMSVAMPGMTTPTDDTGKYLTLWEKQPDGSLKIKVETWNTDSNPMEQKH